jgi:site-specific DNA recombinase
VDTKAVIYTRISLASMGDTTKTDAQEEQCREVCERRGWEVWAVRCDNSRSAWQRDRKRPGWDAMLGDLKSGQVTAIVTYWGDRMVRQPRDLEDLIDLAEGKNLAVASVGGQYDFANPDHRMMMRWEVARACNESDTISRRRKAYVARLRQEGKTVTGGPGGRPFGYGRGGMEIIPAEASAIREASSRILAGEPTGSVARDLAARGVTTPAGKPMPLAVLRMILSRPRTAGLMPDGASAAAWPAILERADWERLRAVLEDRRQAYGPKPGTGRVHLLSGIARCGQCGGPMYVKHGTSTAYYCGDCGGVSRSVRLLDAYVTGRVVAWLANPGNPGLPAPGDWVAAEIADLTERRAETAGAIRSLAVRRGGAPAELAEALMDFDEKIAALRQRAGSGQRERLKAAHAGISAAEFEGLELPVRRALVTAAFAITVKKAARGGGPGFFPADVEMLPAGLADSRKLPAGTGSRENPRRTAS